MNLLVNAVEAMRDIPEIDRTLTIAAHHDGDQVRIEVSDTGRGVSAERAEQIFRPFETTKPNGVGMGLSICRTIVENHGGRMRLAQVEMPGFHIEFTLPIEIGSALSLS